MHGSFANLVLFEIVQIQVQHPVNYIFLKMFDNDSLELYVKVAKSNADTLLGQFLDTIVSAVQIYVLHCYVVPKHLMSKSIAPFVSDCML